MTVMTITVMTVFKNDFLQLYMKCILYIIPVGGINLS